MHVHYKNINDGFRGLLGIFSTSANYVESGSRNGGTRTVPDPVTITYSSPQERVLFNSARDVNPFSLMYESLWTISGRNDVQPISYYTARMTEFSDDGETWHGAYGHRWRHRFGFDQIDTAVRLLEESAGTRRIVINMWCPRADLLEQKAGGKDYPCNTHLYLSVRDGRLSLTVCNRSNDLIWGLTGANYVVFSFLLEYLASRVGVEIGEYHHFTNNLHVYDRHVAEIPKWLAAYDGIKGNNEYDGYTGEGGIVLHKTVPLVRDPATFDREVKLLVEQFSNGTNGPVDFPNGTEYSEPFLETVAVPVFTAFRLYKHKLPADALAEASRIKADDWRIACTAWLKRRQK